MHNRGCTVAYVNDAPWSCAQRVPYTEYNVISASQINNTVVFFDNAKSYHCETSF